MEKSDFKHIEVKFRLNFLVIENNFVQVKRSSRKNLESTQIVFVVNFFI